MAKKNMAEKIKELRLSKGLTLEQVATAVGVGKSTVRKWETGMIANMRRDKIVSLSKALGTSPEYLMGWEDDVKDSPIQEYDSNIKKYLQLTAEGKEKVGNYIDDLLKIPTYQCTEEKQYKIKIAARNGTFEERIITDSDIEKINALPDVDDIDL